MNVIPIFQELELADPCTSDGLETQSLLLICLDYYWEFVSDETIGGPVATHTSLGWILSGPAPWDEMNQQPATLVTHNLKVSAVDNRLNSRVLEHQLRAFWEPEFLGITEKENDVYGGDIVSFRNGRYEVMLPWKDPMSVVPDNYNLSPKRLCALL